MWNGGNLCYIPTVNTNATPLNLKKKMKLLEVTHVIIIKIKYPSMIALAKLIDSIEFLQFGKCGMVANCVTYLQ